MAFVDDDLKDEFLEPIAGHGDVALVTAVLAPGIFDAPFLRAAVLTREKS